MAWVDNKSNVMRLTAGFFIVFTIIIAVGSCSKSDSLKEGTKPVVKPEWRVKRTITQSSNLKLEYGYDTADFAYDARGRLSDIRYRLRAGNTSGYVDKEQRHHRFEYVDTTDEIKKYAQLLASGFTTPSTTEYEYDASGKLSFIQMAAPISEWAAQYHFTQHSLNLPVKYTRLVSIIPGYYYDTTRTTLDYLDGVLAKKVETRHNGININTSTYDYNAAGNIAYHLKIGQYVPNRPDTMRKIFFNWKSSPTPNINKLQPLPERYWTIMNNDVGGLFYFNSYSLLTEVDIYSLCTNGEVLANFKFTWMRNNILPSEMNFEYQLDANNNIGKIVGTAAKSSARFETVVEYERIP